MTAMVIWRAIGRSAAWPIFCASPVDRLHRRPDMAGVRVRLFCRSIDTAARYGGDEFAIILPESNGKEADAVGRRICERLSSDREEPLLSVSVGIAVYPEDGTTIETLFQAADRGLYNMKQRRQQETTL